MDLPALWTTLVALAPAALLWRARHWPSRWRQRVALVLGLGLLAALVYGDRLPVYRGVWYAARPLVPLTVLAGVAPLSGRTRLGAPPASRAPPPGPLSRPSSPAGTGAHTAELP